MLCACVCSSVGQSWPCPLPEDSLWDIFTEAAPPQPSAQEPGPQEPKTASFAMEISVELDKRTGKTQVISTATVTPEIVQGKGLKVYEDGRKSVYALPPGGATAEDLCEMTLTDVEELLRQATDWSGDVQYHQAVYAAPFTGSSRPSTPRTPNKSTQLTSNIGIATPILIQGPEVSDDSLEITNDLSESPYAILGSSKTSSKAATAPSYLIYDKVKTSPPNTTHRYQRNFIVNSMNADSLSPSNVHFPATDTFDKSGTSSPVLSSCQSEMEGFHEDVILDVIQTKNPQRNTTLHYVDDFSTVASEEMSPVQKPFRINESKSLLTTHRYELDLIERSMTKQRTSPMEIVEDNFYQSKTPSPALALRGPLTDFESKTESAGNEERQTDAASACSHGRAALVSVRATSDRMPAPAQPLYKNIQPSPPSSPGIDQTDPDRLSHPESTVNSVLEELAPGAVTMIFMGYEKVDEDEEGSIQAEVVLIGDHDEEEGEEEENLSTIYHPNGYTSRVFQPVVGVAKMSERRSYGGELRWEESLPHKPSFKHRARKDGSCLKNSQRTEKEDDVPGFPCMTK